MNKFLLPTILVLISSVAQAAVTFNCYPLNKAGQAFESGRINCPTKETAKLTDNKLQSVTCVYQALCEPLGPDDKKTELTPQEIMNIYMYDLKTYSFKRSIISCRGFGAVNPVSKELVPVCPSPEKCVDDVLANGTLFTFTSPLPAFTVNAPNLTTERKPVGKTNQ